MGVIVGTVTGAFYINRNGNAMSKLKEALWERTFEKRFWAKVNKTKTCWLWTGSKLPSGYGKLGRGKGMSPLSAHRASYQIHFGKFDEKLSVLHKCDNPSCVNPEHLFLGTQKDNMRDMRKKNRGTSGENHPNAKYNWEIIRAIRSERNETKVSITILAKKYKMPFQYIYQIINQEIWRE